MGLGHTSLGDTLSFPYILFFYEATKSFEGPNGVFNFVSIGGDGTWGYALGAGLAIGLAGLGCGIGQGLTAGNTTAGIARNPGAAGAMFTNFILGMVLIESIAIYGLVIGFMLQGKI